VASVSWVGVLVDTFTEGYSKKLSACYGTVYYG
jgi:hypothetical protein